MRKRRLATLSLIFALLFAARFALPQEIEVFFSPENGCEERICKEIEGAKKSIDVMMYYFTSRKIANALVKAQKRDVSVRAILDSAQRELKYSRWRQLRKAGIPVRFFKAEGLFHHKVAIIDKKIVLSGSFNWTTAAEKKNRENLIIIADEKLATRFAEYFEKLFKETSHHKSLHSESRPPPPSVSKKPAFYVSSRHSNVFHKPTCQYARRIKYHNRTVYPTKREAEKAGKRPCKKCIH